MIFTSIDVYKRQFQNCTGIREAYLDEVSTTLIPDYCFDGATQLYYCSLSDSVKRIGKYAFRNTALSTIRIPGSVQAIDDEAFITDDGAGNVNYIQGLTVQCEDCLLYTSHYRYNAVVAALPCRLHGFLYPECF